MGERLEEEVMVGKGFEIARMGIGYGKGGRL